MPLRLAVVVGGEEPLDRAEARRLHVHRPRRPAERLDVGDRVDHGVPRDPLAVRVEHGLRLGGEGGILEPGVGEAVDDALVERRVGHRVDRRPAVLALEVDRVDGAGRGELLDQLVRPVGRRVELEAKARVVPEPGAQALRRRRLAEAHRDDERQRPRLRPTASPSDEARLAEREVERGALERPAAVVEVRVLVGLVVEERQRREVLARTSSSVHSPAAAARGPAPAGGRARPRRR